MEWATRSEMASSSLLRSHPEKKYILVHHPFDLFILRPYHPALRWRSVLFANSICYGCQGAPCIDPRTQEHRILSLPDDHANNPIHWFRASLRTSRVPRKLKIAPSARTSVPIKPSNPKDALPFFPFRAVALWGPSPPPRGPTLLLEVMLRRNPKVNVTSKIERSHECRGCQPTSRDFCVS